jgi:hypothetical protein
MLRHTCMCMCVWMCSLHHWLHTFPAEFSTFVCQNVFREENRCQAHQAHTVLFDSSLDFQNLVNLCWFLQFCRQWEHTFFSRTSSSFYKILYYTSLLIYFTQCRYPPWSTSYILVGYRLLRKNKGTLFFSSTDTEKG